jgi:hypothetical protein
LPGRTHPPLVVRIDDIRLKSLIIDVVTVGVGGKSDGGLDDWRFASGDLHTDECHVSAT